MRRWLSQIDPDSFRGKLWLLVVDKLIIGALLAVAFILYDNLKTRELRTYSEGREEVQLSFKRAEYVKQLVPTILDKTQDPMLRAHSLGALVDTRSINANSSMFFANQILLSSGSSASPFFSDDQIFIDMLLPVAPEGLAWSFKSYADNDAEDQRARDHDGKTGRDLNYEFAQRFWAKLVVDTIERNDDADLEILDSDEFLAQHIDTLDHMVRFPGDKLGKRDAKQWTESKVKGIRLYGIIKLLRIHAFEKQHEELGLSVDADGIGRREIEFLLAVVDPQNTNTDELLLSKQVIELLTDRHLREEMGATPPTVPIASPEICVRLLTLATRSEVKNAHAAHTLHQPFVPEVSELADWSYRTMEYLAWAASHKNVAERIESQMYSTVENFYEQLKQGSPSALDQHANYMHREMLQALMNTTIESGTPAGERSRKLIARIFDLSDNVLRDAGIARLAQDWARRSDTFDVTLRGSWQFEAE